MRAPSSSPLLTFLTYYHFLHARLINPPPGFYENVVINTRRCRFFSRFAEFNAHPPRARKMPGTESFYLTFPIRGRQGRWTHTRTCTKRRKKGRKRERKKREKRQRAGVGGACAGYQRRRGTSHGVAPRRQASSVARRAPSYSHVTLHRAARAHAVRGVARLDSLDLSFHFLFSFFSFARHRRSRRNFREDSAIDSPNRNAHVRARDFNIDCGINRGNH